MLWHAAFVISGGTFLSAKKLSECLAIPIEQAKWILTSMTEIGAYNPVTRHMDTSRLPEMRWSEPMTSHELTALVRELNGGTL